MTRREILGYNNALKYVITRGEAILENMDAANAGQENVAMGICLILGIAKAELEREKAMTK